MTKTKKALLKKCPMEKTNGIGIAYKKYNCRFGNAML